MLSRFRAMLSVLAMLVAFVFVTASAQAQNPVGWWNFRSGSPDDLTGNFGTTTLYGAIITNGQLVLSATTGSYARTQNYTGPTITTKTLISWVSIDDLNVGGGSALTLEKYPDTDLYQVFDAIVYGEFQDYTWEAGSDNFTRAQGLPERGTQEMAQGTLLKMAIVYESNNQITIYHNDVLYAQYTTGTLQSYAPQDGTDVLFGARHGLGIGYNRSRLTGRIQEARIYDTALSLDQIKALKPVPPQNVISFKSGNASFGQPDPIVYCQGNWFTDPNDPYPGAPNAPYSLQHPLVAMPYYSYTTIPGCQWIGPTLIGSLGYGLPGGYEYYIEFILPQGAATASLALTWAGDDISFPAINGNYLGVGHTLAAPSVPTSFDISALVTAGTNRLSFFVLNAWAGNPNPTGLVFSANIIYTVTPKSTIVGKILFEDIVAYASTQNVTFVFRPLDESGDSTQTVAIPPTGEFSLTVPPNNYTVHVKSDKFLAANVSVDTTNDDVSGVMMFLPAGDADNSNMIDIGDFGVLVSAYGSKSSDPTSGYLISADLNGDGRVDVADFSLLVNNYGVSGDP